MERLHIIDGYGYIFRAHYGLAGAGPAGRGVRLTRADGMPTGALYVYAQMLVRLYLDVKPERVVVVFDAPGKTFRNELDEEYKATRRETPDDLKAQLPHFRPLTEAFAWPVVAVEGVEADDVIATFAKQARERDWEVTIFSADKDLMQLVDEHVQVIDSMRQKVYDRGAVEQKFGVGPEQVADWLALVGDSSDNVPGMAGVGAKTAAKLLSEYGTIDGILEHRGELKGKMRERFHDSEALARLELSRQLVELKTDVELPLSIEDCRPAPWNGAALRKTFEEMEFQALLERLDPASVAVPAAEPVGSDLGPDPAVASSWDAARALLQAGKRAGRLGVEVVCDGDRPDRARVVGLALAAAGQAPLYFPVAHRYLSAPAMLAVADAPAELIEALAGADVAIVCSDAKLLRRALRTLGWSLEGVIMDTMLGGYLSDATREPHGIEEVAEALLDTTLPSAKALLGSGRKAIRFESVAVEDAAAFAGTRAAVAVAAAPALEARLASEGAASLFRDVELPLAAVLADVEDRGIKIDVEHLHTLADRVGAQIAELEARGYELAGEPFNLGSPKQLSHVLFESLGLRAERMRRTKSGAFSTDHEALESLRHAHPIVPVILEHRELTKLKGTYIDALPPLVNPKTGRLHTTFRQAVAATGRLSSQDPNLQNIPIRTELGREIRRAFVADEGRLLVSADYSQIELRVLAHLSGDPVLVGAFRDGIDVHTQTAAEVFGIAREAVGPTERRVAKAVNYGLVYGQSEFGLARALDIGRDEARHYIERYFERFSTVRTFMDELVERARRTGVAETLLGRRRRIHDIGAKNFRLRSAAERVAQNMPMQGSAADIMKLAMLRVEALMAGYGAAMLLTVHDELVVEAPSERAPDVAAVLAREMAAAYQLDVPLVVDVGFGTDWATAH